MDKKKMKKALIGIGRDLLIAFLVVLLVMLILFAYCRVWPPMVVVESGSMEHPPASGGRRSYVGVVDTGDMVFVKDVNYLNELVTYIQGEAIDHSTYGSYGDVVIYRPNGDDGRVPIIHRLVVWVIANDSLVTPLSSGGIDYQNYSFDIPSLGMYGSVENITITNYGYDDKTIMISLRSIINNFRGLGREPHDGFITMGDNNNGPDQVSYLPVRMEWIVGKAIGELPWFGLIKLSITDYPPSAPRNSWTNLFVIVVVLVSVPFFMDFGWPMIKKKFLTKKDVKEDDKEGVDDGSNAVPKERPNDSIGDVDDDKSD